MLFEQVFDCDFDNVVTVITLCVCTLTYRVSRTVFVFGLQMCWFNATENSDVFVSTSLYV